MANESFKLEVPFVHQTNEASCGAAALEMVYRYLGRRTAKQKNIFRKMAEPEPHGSGAMRMSNAGMAEDALNRGLYACAHAFDVTSEEAAIRDLSKFLSQGVPVIACQKFSTEKPLLGHYRVVVGIKPGAVTLNDPFSRQGGRRVECREICGVLAINWKECSSRRWRYCDARARPSTACRRRSTRTHRKLQRISQN